MYAILVCFKENFVECKNKIVIWFKISTRSRMSVNSHFRLNSLISPENFADAERPVALDFFFFLPKISLCQNDRNPSRITLVPNKKIKGLATGSKNVKTLPITVKTLIKIRVFSVSKVAPILVVSFCWEIKYIEYISVTV